MNHLDPVLVSAMETRKKYEEEKQKVRKEKLTRRIQAVYDYDWRGLSVVLFLVGLTLFVCFGWMFF